MSVFGPVTGSDAGCVAVDGPVAVPAGGVVPGMGVVGGIGTAPVFGGDVVPVLVSGVVVVAEIADVDYKLYTYVQCNGVLLLI